MDTDEGLRNEMYKEMAENIANMSNKDAADILRCNMIYANVARANGKSINTLLYTAALQKAIQALESMPEEILSCDGCRYLKLMNAMNIINHCSPCIRNNSQGTVDNYDGEF